MKIKSVVKMNELQGAVARGWCHPDNAKKVMDSELALAISDEVGNMEISMLSREQFSKELFNSLGGCVIKETTGDTIYDKWLSNAPTAKPVSCLPHKDGQGMVILNYGAKPPVKEELDEKEAIDFVNDILKKHWVTRDSKENLFALATYIGHNLCAKFSTTKTVEVPSEMDLACSIGRAIYGKYWNMEDEPQRLSFLAAKAIRELMMKGK